MSVWEMEAGELPVYYFRMEGRVMENEDREHVLTFYRETIAKQEAFATVYDLSQGLPGFADHVRPFARFCQSMRPITTGRLQFTVAVCPNSLYRSFLSMILRLAPSHAPFYLVGNLDEAWAVLARSGEGDDPWDPLEDAAMDLEEEDRC